MKHHSACTVSFLIVPLLVHGCEKKNTSAPPPIIPVNCRVVIVLATADNVGDRQNLACRLTDDEVHQYMLALDNYAPRLGANIRFLYTGIEHWYDPHWLNSPMDLLSWETSEVCEGSIYADPDYDPSKINIYFIGEIQGWFLQDISGISYDPKDVENTVFRPHPDNRSTFQAGEWR